MAAVKLYKNQVPKDPAKANGQKQEREENETDLKNTNNKNSSQPT